MGRIPALALLPLLISASLTARAQGPTSLQINTPIERTISAGQSHEFTVTLEENAWIQFAVEQRGVDVVVKVFAPSGRSLGEFDSPNGDDGPEHVSFVATAAGIYRINVGPLDQNDSRSGRYQIKILELREATEQEIKASQNLEVVKAKGVALLAEMEGLIPEIRSPFTRINAQILAAQLLWEPDQKRATKFLTDAANGVKELLASVDASDSKYPERYSYIGLLRFEMARVLAQHDPDAAISFLYSTVPPPNPYSNQREQLSQESNLELSIANLIMQKDPNRALQIARKSLKSRLSVSLLHTVSTLRRQNPELAAELAGEIANRVLNEKLLRNLEAANLTIGLLRSGVIPGKTVAANQQKTRLLTDAQYRDLVQKAVTEALSFSLPSPQSYSPERDAAWNLLSGLQQMGLELDAVVPGGFAAVEKKVNDLLNVQSRSGSQIRSTIANSPVDAALETIEKAPAGEREQFYMELASREANKGDVTRARQVITERVSNPHQRRNALMNIDQQEIYRALSKGKVEEALRIIGGFRTPKERASQLAQIANQIGPGQKRANAINLLEQARALLGSSVQAQDQEQMNALFEIARAFSRYDSKRSFEIIDPLIDQVNEICTAARTLEGFGAENYDDEELNLQNGSIVAQTVTRMSNTLGTLAVTNFDRAKAAADRIRQPEVRLRAYLDIAQQTIMGVAK